MNTMQLRKLTFSNLVKWHQTQRVLKVLKEEFQPYCRIPYIPGGTFHQIRRAPKDAGVNTCATSGQKLGQVLCGKNKTHLEQNRRKGTDLPLQL